MDNENKILLNSVRTPSSVNVDSNIQFGITNTNKPIPLNDIDTTVSQFQQFEKERKKSTTYRFYGVVSPIISNPIFNDNIKISRNGDNVTSKKILSSDIFEKDGWIGFYNDELDETALQFNDNKSALCEFFPFDPGYDRLKMLDSDGVPNYLFKVTYPFRNKNISLIRNSSKTLEDGIPIIDKFIIKLNGRLYTGFKTAINHGLSVNDSIKLLSFIDNSITLTNTVGGLALNERDYRVFKLGNQSNDNKFRVFVVDIDPFSIDFTIGESTVKRIVDGKESNYYVREFKSLTTDYKDYDIYPAAYGTTYFNDDVAAFNFIKDVDVDGLVDNLGRPLSELYLTIVKNDSDASLTSPNTQYWMEQQSGLTVNADRFWTPIIAGYELENNENLNYNVRAYGDPDYSNNLWYGNIDETNIDFDGDIVEYNVNDLLERRLELVYHRINTVYRENLNSISNDIFLDKKEGYIYNPFKKIQIREFSTTINPTVNLQPLIDEFNITEPSEIENLKNSFGVPDYAYSPVPNLYRWRTLLEIGEVDETGVGVDYPFESGAHYMYLNNRFMFQRQDPPCEFILISDEVTLGSSSVDPGNLQQEKFVKLLGDPTYLNYELLYLSYNGVQSTNFRPILDTILGNPPNIVNYNGISGLTMSVNRVSYQGEYELGKRDVAGGCVDLSLLKQKDVDDVC